MFRFGNFGVTKVDTPVRKVLAMTLLATVLSFEHANAWQLGNSTGVAIGTPPAPTAVLATNGTVLVSGGGFDDSDLEVWNGLPGTGGGNHADTFNHYGGSGGSTLEGWLFVGPACGTAHATSPFAKYGLDPAYCASNDPNAIQNDSLAYMQGSQCSITNSNVPVPVSGEYRVRFLVAAVSANNCGTLQQPEIDVELDGQLVATVNPQNRVLADSATASVFLEAGMTSIRFSKSSASNGSGSAGLIDNVRLEYVEGLGRSMGGSFEEHPLPTSNGDDQESLSVFGAAPGTRGHWRFGAACGIANRDSFFVKHQLRPNFPGGLEQFDSIDGDQVAYMQGEHPVSVAFVEGDFGTVPAGEWIVRYKVSRLHTTVPENTFYTVKINGELVGYESVEYPADSPGIDPFQEFSSRVWTTDIATRVVVEFAKAADPDGQDDDKGLVLLDDIRLEHVREWSDSANWLDGSGAPLGGTPGTSDKVLIPEGGIVAFSGSADVDSLEIQGEFESSSADGSLSTKWALVHGSLARWTIGHPYVPFLENFSLELVGESTDVNFTGSDLTTNNSKFLMARMGGRVDMHGAPKVSWDHLSETIDPNASNANELKMSSDSIQGWANSDKIVVAGSTLQPADDSYTDYAEARVIQSISPTSPATIVVQTAFAEDHSGYQTSIPSTFSNVPDFEVDMRAEVANLTRNIKVSGRPGSTANFGGNIMIMGGSAPGRGRFSNVELFQMGQEGKLGRYPIHFHMMLKAGFGSFVKSCAIHNTFNRAITIHGTDSVVLDSNVAYDTLGHAYFLEDGSEQFNVITGNLALSTKKPNTVTILSDDSLDNFQDRTPASFWITNPHNVVVGNVAGGSAGTGFWLIFPRRIPPGTLSVQESDLLARTAPIFQSFMYDENGASLFANNKAHNCGIGIDFNDAIPDGELDGSNSLSVIKTGIRQDTTWRATRPLDPMDPDGVRVESPGEEIFGFSVYSCGTGIYGSTGGEQVIFRNLVAFDNKSSAEFASYTRIEESFMADRMGAPSDGTTALNTRIMTRLYDGASRFDKVLIHGFDGTQTAGQTDLFVSYRGAAVNHPNEVFGDLHYTAGTGPPAIYSNAIPIVLEPGPEPLSNSGCSLVDEFTNFIGVTGDLDSAANPLAASNWSKTILDVGGNLTGSSSQYPQSIIRDFPMLKTKLCVPYLNSVGSSGPLWVSPHSFGQLRLNYPEFSGPTSTAMNLFLRRDVTGTGSVVDNPPVTYRDHYNSRFYKQFAVIVQSAQTPVDEVMEYTLNHEDPMFGTTQPGGIQILDLHLDDVREGDTFWIWLSDFACLTPTTLQCRNLGTDPSDLALGNIASSTDLTTVESATVPMLYFASDGAVALRVVVRSAANGSIPSGVTGRYESAEVGEQGGSRNRTSSLWRQESFRFYWGDALQ